MLVKRIVFHQSECHFFSFLISWLGPLLQIKQKWWEQTSFSFSWFCGGRFQSFTVNCNVSYGVFIDGFIRLFSSVRLVCSVLLLWKCVGFVKCLLYIDTILFKKWLIYYINYYLILNWSYVPGGKSNLVINYKSFIFLC